MTYVTILYVGLYQVPALKTPVIGLETFVLRGSLLVRITFFTCKTRSNMAARVSSVRGVSWKFDLLERARL